VPPFIPPTASMPTSSSAMSLPTSSGANNESSNDKNTTHTNAADGGEAEGDPHAAALAQLRAELASTQAALEEAVRAAAGLVISTAGQGSALPSDVLSDSANDDAAHSDSVPSSGKSSYSPPTFSRRLNLACRSLLPSRRLSLRDPARRLVPNPRLLP
jgi:hypothetical protein